MTDELGAFGAVVRVHEEENDENGFAGGDDQSDDDVQAVEIRVEVDGRGVDSGECENHQHGENQKIDFWRNNMFGSASDTPLLNELLMPVNQI